ncbi:Rpn family recombination-promoting nuclease/putative transposase [Pseudonocardia sp. RS11V-5]|uniref:Rpn family recombination-promoting nuclease/putative transposase n=1 Tax=Pseudonocardia terrae TaxID=2905831 RepID=UPI001E2C786A|nr:Rpn family recombination-promoting nuclease/putative transposase [Pseudonocardia terrae]MCE3554943.1 Rpn family recombination-promoting nuclease/putative transposase [Pseudonocardia terrae]
MGTRTGIRTTRLLGAATAVAALVGGAVACAAPAPAAGAAEAAPAPVDATCATLVKVDAVPPPAGDPSTPDPAAVREWAGRILPLLDSAVATAPADVRPSLTALQGVLKSAATTGTAAPTDAPVVAQSVNQYEAWAYDHCGYSRVEVTATEFRLDGVPATLHPGPAAFRLTNRSTANLYHGLLIVRPKDQAMTVAQVVATTPELLAQQVDVVPGATTAAPGQQGGMLVDLPAGRYIVLCPLGSGDGPPHLMRGMVAEVSVA